MHTDLEEEESKPGRGNSKCTDPGAEVRPECLECRMEARLVEQGERSTEQRVGNKDRAHYVGLFLQYFY